MLPTTLVSIEAGKGDLEMCRKEKCVVHNSREAGVALPTVLVVTFFLVAASVAMLSAASSNSKNTTDVLAETKAFYVAESGIQAAINVLRNGGVTYKQAVNNAANSGDLSTWLPYTSGRVSVGEGGYSLTVTDPDNSQAQIQFSTYTTVAPDGLTNTTSGFSLNGTTFTDTITFTDPVDATNRTTISWAANNQAARLFSGAAYVDFPLGNFVVTNEGAGAAITQGVYFRINLRLVAPDKPTWVMKGTIASDTFATPRDLVFQSYQYGMVGSDIILCQTDACTTLGPTKFSKVLNRPAVGLAGSETTGLGVRMTPKEPQRLLLKSVGYGPNDSRKVLQSFIHKSLFPMVPPAAGILMNGPNPLFDNGNGKPQYYGCDPMNPDVCVPSIGVTDPDGLDNVTAPTVNYQNAPPGCGDCPPVNPYPAPAIVGEELPDWQRYPANMDQMIAQWKNATPASSQYANGAVINTGGWGNFSTGVGLTYCAGDCTVKGSGGGILVVKGSLTLKGGVDFKGYIIVVGPDGMHRDGAGGHDDEIIGGVIISPYTLTPSPGSWLQPRYSANGGGTSHITYSSLEYLFGGGITGTTNFVTGVAEK
jgi:hypothetical protein